MTDTDLSPDQLRVAGFAAYRANDFDAAYELLLPLAEAGDPKIQAMIGMLLGVPNESSTSDKRIEAIKWLDLAVRAGEAGAKNNYESVLGRSDPAEIGEGKRRGFEWQQHFLNAENGQPPEAAAEIVADLANLSPEDAFELGLRLLEGDGVPIDYAKSFACFERAAADESPTAQYNLGLSHYTGKGVTANTDEAVAWFLKAAMTLYPPALTMMAVLMLRGEGVEQDRQTAVLLLTQAAQLGDEQAASLLEAVKAGATFD